MKKAILNAIYFSLQFLKEGIHYLIKMLDFRSSDNPNEEFVVQDRGTAILVNEGKCSILMLLSRKNSQLHIEIKALFRQIH